MTEKQLNYLKILNDQKNKGIITKKFFKKEVKFIKSIKKRL